MAKHAKSITLKKREAAAQRASQLDRALQLYRTEQSKPPQLRIGLRSIANQFPGVSYSTLWRRAQGKRSIQEFNASKQKLTVAEEEVLTQLIETSADWSNPLSYDDIAHYANIILCKRGGDESAAVGISWVYRFLERHHDRVQTYWSKSLDTQRAQSLNAVNVKDWFEVLRREIVDKEIKHENIYGMDKSGFPPSNQGTSCVVGRRGNKLQHKQGSGNRENATGLICICADGTAIQPLIVFKSEYLYTRWFENNVANAAFTRSPNGWTDSDIAMEWMRTIFDPLTKEKAAGHTRVLLMDGHSSHFSLVLLEYCINNNIVVISYPAHCTHALQGLDVVCFAKMKRIWHNKLDEHFKTTGVHVNKNTYAQVFGTAYMQAFDPKTILAAFKATGVHPYNPTVITEQQLKPSEHSSTTSVFPLPMASPVRRVIAAFHQPEHEPEPDITTHTLLLPLPTVILSPPANTPQTTLRISQAHSTPNISRGSNLDIDPVLLTPTRHISALRTSLASSSIRSCLISKPRIDSITKPITPVINRQPYLPEPNWSLRHPPITPDARVSVESVKKENETLRTNLALAYDQINAARSLNEAANAQLIVQHLQATQTNTALHEKSKLTKEKRGERIGADGKAVVYTSAEVVEIKRKMEEDAQLQATHKKARAELRARNREEKEKVKEKWAEICRVHTQNKSEWKIVVEQLRKQKVPRNRWPKAPVRPRKPQVPPELCTKDLAAMGEGDQEGSVSSSDDGNDTDCD